MTASKPILLALDADTRRTGWAVFEDYAVAQSGVITFGATRAGTAQQRIECLIAALDEVAARFRPAEVALSSPSGLRWEVPALALLESELAAWARRSGLPLTAYPVAQIRREVAQHPRAPAPALAFAVMTALDMVGTAKSTHEWEAIAAGAYHLSRTGAAAG